MHVAFVCRALGPEFSNASTLIINVANLLYVRSPEPMALEKKVFTLLPKDSANLFLCWDSPGLVLQETLWLFEMVSIWASYLKIEDLTDALMKGQKAQPLSENMVWQRHLRDLKG
jgi:hypothetical protein